MDTLALQEELERINQLALWDFEIAGRDDGSVLVLASNDFTYYHYLEVEFRGVTYCDLPDTFPHAQFRLGRDIADGIATIWITAESMNTKGPAEFEIRATGIQARVGKVYYDNRENLRPGERLASRKVDG